MVVRAIVRGVLLAGSTSALILVATGCGGSSKAPSVANLAPTTSATRTANSPSTVPNRAILAACLTSHGFQAAVGSAGTVANSAISIAGVVVSGIADPRSPQFQAALQACRKYLPAGPPPLSQAQQAAAAKAMLAFASCMRTHGVPGFPDPNSQGLFPLAGMKGIDPSSPLLLTAFKSCQQLEPKVGPRIDFEAGGNVAERSR